MAEPHTTKTFLTILSFRSLADDNNNYLFLSSRRRNIAMTAAPVSHLAYPPPSPGWERIVRLNHIVRIGTLTKTGTVVSIDRTNLIAEVRLADTIVLRLPIGLLGPGPTPSSTIIPPPPGGPGAPAASSSSVPQIRESQVAAPAPSSSGAPTVSAIGAGGAASASAEHPIFFEFRTTQRNVLEVSGPPVASYSPSSRDRAVGEFPSSTELRPRGSSPPPNLPVESSFRRQLFAEQESRERQQQGPAGRRDEAGVLFPTIQESAVVSENERNRDGANGDEETQRRRRRGGDAGGAAAAPAPPRGSRPTTRVPATLDDILTQTRRDYLWTQLPRSSPHNLDTKECVMCLLDFEPLETVLRMPCLHSFHEHCVRDWFLARGSCPVCSLDVCEIYMHTRDS